MDSLNPTPQTPPTPEVPLQVSDEQIGALLTDTLALLGTGLPEAQNPAGPAELERWEAVLAASDRPGLAKITQELGQLRQLLNTPDAPGHDMAELLASLGAEAAKVADGAGSSHADQLRSLSKVLIKAGNLLSR